MSDIVRFRNCSWVAALFVLLLHGGVAFADIMNFDSLSDLESVTTQYQPTLGVVFQNAIVLKSGAVGGSLNELDFPPHSDFNVIFDNGGPIIIDFAPAVVSISGFFTYNTALLMQAFGASHNLLGSAGSGCASNFVSAGSGCTPNEAIGIAGLGDIAEVIVTGDAAGFSFALDDLTFDRSVEAPVPEPASFVLLISCVTLVET